MNNIAYVGGKKEPEEELVTDVLAILNVYVAKMNGLRKYKKNKKEIKKNYEYKEDNCIKKMFYSYYIFIFIIIYLLRLFYK